MDPGSSATAGWASLSVYSEVANLGYSIKIDVIRPVTA